MVILTTPLEPIIFKILEKFCVFFLLQFLKSSIQRIKQNVYNGTFITMQELSKRYNMMVNGKNVETERVDKLKKEIANLKARLVCF